MTQSTSATAGCAVSLYHPDGLSQGNHTLKVVVDGSHDSSASNDYVVIDRVDITNVPLTLVDDETMGSGTNQFNYSGSGWGHCTNFDTDNIGRYDASNSWDTTPGDSLTFQFNGSRIVFYVVKGNNTGKFDVSIDGGSATTIDTYSAGDGRGGIC